MGYEILLYVPNIIGYLRLGFLAIAWVTFRSDPLVCFITYFISAVLDCVDGYAARKLNQTSAFGAWFDVLIDNVSRGMLWSRLYQGGYLVACIEWLCFVCTHTKGAQWKTAFMGEPWFVKAVMANGYKTPLGVIAIGGLHVLPLVLYAHYSAVLSIHLAIPNWLQYTIIGLLSAGRALCFAVEVWCIWSHINYLVSDEANSNKESQ